MTSVSPRSRLEQELRTTLSQLLVSERETSALTDALDGALRRDPQARVIAARLLDDYCAGATPNARAEALRDHLDRALPVSPGREAAGTRQVASDLHGALSQPPSTAPLQTDDGVGSLAGTVLKGRFVLKQPIGRGVTGVVYRAYDRSPGLHPAQIAVKVLHEELQREQVTLARVRHDFAVSQALEHPNIAKVFDFHRDERYCFYTMELLDGESLRRLIDLLGPEPLALEEVSSLIRDMGAALAYAHRRDIVHGDFKPENVVVTRNLSAKVLDFGFAGAALAVQRRLGAQAEREATPTPAYASGEVLEGKDPEAIDDVYSFACVCYELLAGHLPFGALNALAARDAGLEPVRIERLSDAQWTALSRALALRARDRRIAAGELVARLCVDVRPPAIAAPRLPARPEDARRRAPATPPRSRGRHEPVRSRRPRRSHPWLAAGLVAGIGVALGILYVALEREAQIQRVTETVALPASERAAPPTEDRPARADAEPVARVTGESTTPATSSQPSQSADSTPAVSSNEPAAPPAGSPTPSTSASAPAAAGATAGTPGEVALPEAAPSAAGTATTATGFAFQAPRYAMSESKSLISIPIARTDGHGSATVVWWTVEGDARAYEDYAYLGRRMESFADGETTRYIQIPVVSDQIAEGDEDFYVELASPGAVADADTLTRTEVVIRDDD
jgi:serine/threonine protein kinase